MERYLHSELPSTCVMELYTARIIVSIELRRTLNKVVVITFLLWERVWEVNVHLLRTFTDSPDLTVTNGIAFRPDERY